MLWSVVLLRVLFWQVAQAEDHSVTCGPGLFRQLNKKCCAPIEVLPGYEYEPCLEDGLQDTLVPCGKGEEQPNTVPSWYRPKCERRGCLSAHTVLSDDGQCVCNMDEGYCGTQLTHAVGDSTNYMKCVVISELPHCPSGVKQDCSCDSHDSSLGSSSTSGISSGDRPTTVTSGTTPPAPTSKSNGSEWSRLCIAVTVTVVIGSFLVFCLGLSCYFLNNRRIKTTNGQEHGQDGPIELAEVRHPLVRDELPVERAERGQGDGESELEDGNGAQALPRPDVEEHRMAEFKDDNIV